jgi:hypothetical protein
MRVFEFAIDARLHDLHEAYGEYSNVAAFCAIIKQGEEDQAPNAARISQLDKLTLPLLEAYSMLRHAIEDYQRELQRITLVHLFKDAEVLKRDFVNPLHKPISLEEADEWIRYFKEETRWGKKQNFPMPTT